LSFIQHPHFHIAEKNLALKSIPSIIITRIFPTSMLVSKHHQSQGASKMLKGMIVDDDFLIFEELRGIDHGSIFQFTSA
jgi:hypothetical protein